MATPLGDRVVVISGATGALGRVVAESSAREGARLALLGRDAARLAALRDELALTPDRCLTKPVDLRDAHGAQEAAVDVRTHLGRAQVLLHLVGGWSGGTSVADLPSGHVAAMLDQHLWTTLNLLQAFLPQLVEGGWGRVIAVSSPFATRPPAKGAAYAVGKAAQEALLMSLAQELSGTGVTANLLLVRAIQTAAERGPRAQDRTSTTPREITAAMLYLCSEEGGAVNGARLPLYPPPAG